MVWTNDYRLHSIVWNPVGASEVTLSAMSNQSLQANSEVLREVPGGALFAESASLQTVRPLLSFTTFDLATAISAFGIGGSGGCITSDVDEPGLDLYFAKRTCAGFDAASTHLKYNVAAGIIVPRSLNVSHRENATITYDVYVSSDGTNSPIVKDTGQTLPTLSTNDDRWTVGPMSVAGTAVEGKRDITIDFNPTVTQSAADSTTFDSVVSLDNFLQRVTVQGVEPSWFDDDGTPTVATLSGKTVSDSTTNIILRKRNTLDTATEHIRLQLNGLLTWDNIISGDPRSPATTGFAIDLTRGSGGNAPIIAATDHAISS